MTLWQLTDFKEAQTLLKNKLKKIISEERIPVDQSLTRLASQDVLAAEPLPAFRKSTLDGYAVRAKDTYGSSSSLPVILDLVENIHIGQAPKKSIGPGQAAYIPTGGMVPQGADAVVMVEYSQELEGRVALERPVSPLEGVVDIGDDLAKGQVILKKGAQVNSTSYGLIKAQGIQEIPVYKKLKVALISTGDELVHPDQEPGPGQIRDINSYSLATLAKKAGMEIIASQVIKDRPQAFKEACLKYRDQADLIVLSGGSSKGQEDYSLATLEDLGQVLFHGISIQPGKPTLASYSEEDRTLFLGLPGHPMAAILVFKVFLAEAISQVMGQKERLRVRGRLASNIAGAPGRDRLVPASLDYQTQVLIHPIHTASANLSGLAGADGYFIIDKKQEGYDKGQEIDLYLFRGGRL